MPSGPLLTPVVTVAGQALAGEWLAALTELHIDRAFQVPGQCTLRFADPGYALAASATFAVAGAVEVSEGEGAATLFKGEVTSIAVEQRMGEQPELVVVAYDKSHRMGLGTRVKGYADMDLSDIVTQLATSSGLTAQSDTTGLTQEYFFQVDSDLGLLTALARRTGYDWWVDGEVLYFQKPASQGSVSLSLGDDLLAFSVKANGRAPTETMVDGWDRQGQVMVTGQAAPSWDTGASDLAGNANNDARPFGDATLVSTALGATSAQEAQVLSTALMDRATAAAVAARGVAPGNGRIGLGVTVTVAQAGPLNGSYPVTRVEHVYRPTTGYVTRFASGDRRPTSLVDSLVSTPSGTGALVEPGLRVGTVTSNNDPNNTGRVKVLYPGVDQQYSSGWARVLGVGGGPNRGNVFVPEVNDEVLVGFEGGDLRQPVVLGGLYGSKSTIPTVSIEDGAVQQRGMTSRLGHSVMLLDGTAEADQAIVLELAGSQHLIHLGKDKLDVAVPASTPVNIAAGDTTIAVDDQGNVSVSAPKVTISAQAEINLSAPNVSISADAQLSLKSNGTAELKGSAMLDMGADGEAKLAGAMVMIN
jgi:uncharacterized protein involved in type VI secretion and phage assembly